MNKVDIVQRIPLMIVGSQKSGTSSLLRYLAQHPEIYAHPQPEMTFFLQDHEYEKGFKSAYNKYYSECPDNNHLIAKNVMIMCSPERIQRIYEHNPEMHLVVLLREPVARAYSAYWWARRRGWENIKSFEEALEVEEKRLNEDWFKWRQCAYIFNSTYIIHIQNLISQFGENQVHCFLTDDLKENAIEICQKVYHLIGVKKDYVPVVDHQYNQAAIPRSEKFGYLFTQFLSSQNPLRRAMRKIIPTKTAYKLKKVVFDLNDKPFTPPPINPKTHRELSEYFQPYNEELAALLDKDLSHWQHSD